MKKQIYYELKFPKGTKVIVKESSDGLGIIIDVFKGDELFDTNTYWYDDM